MLGESVWLLNGNSWQSSPCAAFTSRFWYVSLLLQRNLTMIAKADAVAKIPTAITPVNTTEIDAFNEQTTSPKHISIFSLKCCFGDSDAQNHAEQQHFFFPGSGSVQWQLKTPAASCRCLLRSKPPQFVMHHQILYLEIWILRDERKHWTLFCWAQIKHIWRWEVRGRC